jgi:hypothetical protein
MLGTDVVVSGRTTERLGRLGESLSFVGRVGSIFGQDATTECLVGDNMFECRLRLQRESSFFKVASIFGQEAATECFVGDNWIASRSRGLSQSSRQLLREDLQGECAEAMNNLFFKDESIISGCETRVSYNKIELYGR